MSIVPSLAEFKRLARRGNLVPVRRELLADLETPVSAYAKIAADGPSFLLESVEGGERLGRYSFIGARPFGTIRAAGGRGTVEIDGRTEDFEGDPLVPLRAALGRYRPVRDPALPRFSGGAVGYLSYDAVRFFEPVPVRPGRGAEGYDPPDALFLLVGTVVVFDHVRHRVQVVAQARIDGDAEAAYRDACDRIHGTIERLRRPATTMAPAPRPAAGAETCAFSRKAFEAAVRRAKRYIAAGDCFQVVLARRIERPTAAPPLALYRALRATNPSPYMFLLSLGDLSLVGSSPEVMVRLEGDRITLRPIAGTRRRGADEDEDRALEAELRADAKERAEHVMLVDLGRNDVGRVARAGSVRVDEFMTVERYSHVMHLVSNVTGRLAKGRDAADLLRATFPAGTVSGAPKVRAMEIIEELEPVARGPYAGAVGYVGFDGSMDTAISIRTIVLSGGVARIGAGAGIVADSVPAREFEETERKAQAMRAAIEWAERGLE